MINVNKCFFRIISIKFLEKTADFLIICTYLLFSMKVPYSKFVTFSFPILNRYILIKVKFLTV